MTARLDRRTRIARASLALLVGLGAYGLDLGAPRTADARAQQGVCEVYKGKTRIDQNSCLAREICYYNQTRGSQLCRTEYLWVTKATTLVTYDQNGQPSLVNGAPAQPRTVNGRTCALNTVSGNTFCYRQR